MDDSFVISTGWRSFNENCVEVYNTDVEPSEIILNATEPAVSGNESVICLDEDEISEVPYNETSSVVSSTNLPVIYPTISDRLDSPPIDHSNNSDDDFTIVFEKKVTPLEVQVLDNYRSPVIQHTRRHRRNRPLEQRQNNTNQQDVVEQRNHSLAESISFMLDSTLMQSVNQSNVQNTPQHSVLDLIANQQNEVTIGTSPLDDSICCIDTASEKIIKPLVKNDNLNATQSLTLEDVNEKKKRRIECGVCFDGPDEIEKRGLIVVSTVCGHIFCSECIKTCIKTYKHCPLCRKRLTMKQFHILHV